MLQLEQTIKILTKERPAAFSKQLMWPFEATFK
jgi:hypothetical protein